jgi:hypothetical protein
MIFPSKFHKTAISKNLFLNLNIIIGNILFGTQILLFPTYTYCGYL